MERFNVLPRARLPGRVPGSDRWPDPGL